MFYYINNGLENDLIVTAINDGQATIGNTLQSCMKKRPLLMLLILAAMWRLDHASRVCLRQHGEQNILPAAAYSLTCKQWPQLKYVS